MQILRLFKSFSEYINTGDAQQKVGISWVILLLNNGGSPAVLPVPSKYNLILGYGVQ